MHISFFLSVFFFASFLLLSIFLAPDKDNFLSKALVLHCFLVFRRIGEYISLVLFYNLTSSCSLIFQKSIVFFQIHEITRVVVLYTSLRLVEGVYKPQGACVGWANVTESCLEACLEIKRTCLDEFPPGHPKMFERTLDIISLFVLAISNAINLFPNLLCCSLWKR